MIYLAITYAIAMSCLTGLCVYIFRNFEEERKQWCEERQILLNRIENPSYRPPITQGEKQANVEEIRRLREESEQFGLVGRILE